MDSSKLAKRSVVLLVALLLGSTTINYIDRQVLSVLAPTIRDEYRISNEEYAWIVNAFMVAYAAGMPLSGWLLDKIGVARGLTMSAGLWSFAGMLTSLAKGPISLAGFRALLALGESGAWPAFAKAVATYVPPRWKTFAMGVCNSGSSLGAMIAPPLVAWIAVRMGWQGAFLVTGALGLFWVLAFLWFCMRNRQMWERQEASERVAWSRLLPYRETWIVFVCRFIADPIWYFYIFWIPEFLTRERGLSLVQIGAVAWVPFLVSDIANFAGGLLAQRLQARGWSVDRTRKAMMLLGAAGAPVGVAAVYAKTLFWTMAFISVAIFFWMLWSVTVQTLPGDYFPPKAVGSVYGIGGLGSSLGSVVSIWLVGRTLDLTGSYATVFIGLGLLMPLACGAGFWLMGKVDRVRWLEA